MLKQLLALVAGVLFMFPSFAEVNAEEQLQDFTIQPGYSEISQSIAHALMEQGVGVVIDVRTPEEFASGHIEGALNISSDTIKEGVDLPYELKKDEPLLIYCRSGRRASMAGQILVKNGYHYVLNFGGVLTWPYGLVQ